MENSKIIETLAMIAGFLLSLAMEIPFIKKGYDQLSDGVKRLVMAGLLIVSAAALYGIGCSGFLDIIFPGIAITCDQAGIILLVRALVFALVTNQGTFGLFFRGRPKPATDEATAHLTGG